MKRKFHVGFGEEGACFLPDVNQERRRALTLPVLDRAGHSLQMEQPVLFEALTGEWLDRVEEVACA